MNAMCKEKLSWIADACRDCTIDYKKLVEFHKDQLTYNPPQQRTLNQNHAFKDAPLEVKPTYYPNDITHDLDEGNLNLFINL